MSHPTPAMLRFDTPPRRPPPCSKRAGRSARYVRVSRATPDRIIARFAALKPTTTAATSNETWALKICWQRASTTGLRNPKRKELLVLLKKAAERAETTAAARSKEASMATPAAGAAVARQETQVLKEPARSGLGGEVPQRLVESPYVPTCAL